MTNFNSFDLKKKMACRYCGIKMFKNGYCDKDCYSAYLIQESIPEIEKMITQNDKNFQGSKENLKKCIHENWIDFHKHMMKSEFAEKLFYTALLKRESRQTLNKLRKEFIKATEKTFNLMFEDDTIKQTFPKLFYDISCLLKTDVKNTVFDAWIDVFSKVD